MFSSVIMEVGSMFSSQPKRGDPSSLLVMLSNPKWKSNSSFALCSAAFNARLFPGLPPNSYELSFFYGLYYKYLRMMGQIHEIVCKMHLPRWPVKQHISTAVRIFTLFFPLDAEESVARFLRCICTELKTIYPMIIMSLILARKIYVKQFGKWWWI